LNLSKLNTKSSNMSEAQQLIGNNDKNIKTLEKLFHVQLIFKGDEFFVGTEDEKILNMITDVINAMKQIISRNINITSRDVTYLANMVREGKLDEALDIYFNRKEIITTFSGKTIYAKSIIQRLYLKAINENDLVFGIGPAGTGKTFVAVIHAVQKLKTQEIKKIILTRPAVEAGESLGFLPGDLKEKVDPYLQPLYDALYEALGQKNVETFLDKGIIEIAPLAYMRGRTLDNAYVILDEAQNTTEKQMKMFLTRLGMNSKMIITGDITQIDLPGKEKSGLVVAAKLLKDVNGIELIKFSKVDVIRHPLVQEILRKYEKYENGQNKLL